MKKSTTGFTIVELLIVIVVIAILASISIVAYNGIQARASDSAVSSDTTNLYKKIQLFIVDNGRPPITRAEMDSLDVKVSQGQYTSSTGNASLYCYNASIGRWSIGGSSKSGNGFYYRSDNGSIIKTTSWTTGKPCSDFGVFVSSPGDVAMYKDSPQTWSQGGITTP